jgi:hypothetical protein
MDLEGDEDLQQDEEDHESEKDDREPEPAEAESERQTHEDQAQADPDTAIAIFNLTPAQAQAQAQCIRLMRFRTIPCGIRDWEVPIPVGPKEHISKVIVMPCGIKVLGLDAAAGPLTEEEMGLAMDQVHTLNQMVCTPPSLFLDVRGAREGLPSKQQRLSSHIGHNDRIVQQVLAQRDVVQYVRNQLYAFFERYGPDPGHSAQWAIIVACKSGKHRSVAWSNIISHCLAQRGYLVRKHYQAVDWQGTCEGKCPDCLLGPSDATLLKAKLAMAMWTVGP